MVTSFVVMYLKQYSCFTVKSIFRTTAMYPHEQIWDLWSEIRKYYASSSCPLEIEKCSYWSNSQAWTLVSTTDYLYSGHWGSCWIIAQVGFVSDAFLLSCKAVGASKVVYAIRLPPVCWFGGRSMTFSTIRARNWAAYKA